MIPQSKDYSSLVDWSIAMDKYFSQTQVTSPCALCEGKEKEIAELKAKINELTMDNMTHEYNQAEAEKFAPEYKRQIEEPLSQRISELEAENERLQSLL